MARPCGGLPRLGGHGDDSDCEEMDPELESDRESDMEIDESEDDMEF